ncbi:MAG: PhnD/SsuA/transferrin family substrate-binding protein [Paracoccaceae bacterium]
MTAMLGMYDIPQLAGANDKFWEAIRKELGEGPELLDRRRDLWEIWRDPDLVFAQTCGMPFRTTLHGYVSLVGTPDYNLPGCAPGYYNSVIIARADSIGQTLTDFAGQRFAYNEPISQSGWAAPMTHAARSGTTFRHFVQTGGHKESAIAVAVGRADTAAIDALTWALIIQYESWAEALREVERTTPTPGLPYITSKTRNTAQIFEGVQCAIAALSDADRETLHLRGLVKIAEQAYLDVPTPPPPS